jgi:hypothetical protein
MNGYIITKGQSPNTYTGYRMATSDMEVLQGEKFIESLNGYAQEILALPQTPQDKLRELTALMAGLDLPTQASLISVSGDVITALNAGNVPLADFIVEGIDTTNNPQLTALKTAIQAILRA